MTILPNYRETIVLIRQREEVYNLLKAKTTDKLLFENQQGKEYAFTGWVKTDHFRISLKINRPNNYIPLITGKLEATSTGCILFTTYKLFPVTKMFLTFWTFIILLAGGVAGFQYSSITYPAISIFIAGLVLWIAWSNFRMHIKPSRDTLMGILS